jgi:chromosomal replication initiation ATPase DnaA
MQRTYISRVQAVKSISEIVKASCDFYQEKGLLVTPKDVLTKNRGLKRFADARLVSMTMAYRILGLSHKSVAKAFGKKHPSSSTVAVHRVENSSELQNDYEQIKKSLNY